MLSDLTIGICRFKKPHRHFLPGDLFVGRVCDGCADNLRGWGWSSKHRRVVGGKHGYRVHYCGWEKLPARYLRAAENAGREIDPCVANGSGHLKVLKWIKNAEFGELPRQPRDEAWLRRLLLELSCGNMPLSREEAAPFKRIAFLHP